MKIRINLRRIKDKKKYKISITIIIQNFLIKNKNDIGSR